ncbi:unnamed protein product [Camellia sinensis]
MLIKERRQKDGTYPSQRSSDLLQSTPHDNLPTSVNEVGSITESIEAMKISKRVGSSIANVPICLDTFRKLNCVYTKRSSHSTDNPSSNFLWNVWLDST